jgi:DNA-binding transcriptional regulator YiaG
MRAVYVRTLRRAAEIAGGAAEFATRLGISQRSLSVWIAGVEPVPTEIFLRAVDIVLDHAFRAASSRPQAQNDPRATGQSPPD